MKSLIRCTLLTTVVGTLALGLGGPTRAADDTLKIAIAGPITGPVGQYGDMQMVGARMAVEQINAKGGVGGKQLEAVLLDDVC